MTRTLETQRGVQEFALTEAYLRHKNSHPALREAACLAAQFPACLKDPEPGDLFAGRLDLGLVGFSPETHTVGYFCDRKAVLQKAADPGRSAAERSGWKEVAEFWKTETTEFKVRLSYSPAVARLLPSDNWTGEPGIAFPLYRMAGGYLDFEKLLRLGIPGLLEEAGRARRAHPDQAPLFQGMQSALLTLRTSCFDYADRLRRGNRGGIGRIADSEAMAENLEAIALGAPASFRQAIQLLWLYALVSGVKNYGRMDLCLGPFLDRDLREGDLREAEALRLLESLWRLIRARNEIFNGRILIGGRGRSQEAQADRFALLALRATLNLGQSEPQLSLRFHKDMDPRLWASALDLLGRGRTYPILYNDDVNIPAVARAFAVPESEAEQYMPFGCGEYVLDHRSFGTPNTVINLAKALEVTLHNGVDPVSGRRMGLSLGPPESFETFEGLFGAYARQVEAHAEICAEQAVTEYKVMNREASCLYHSLLYDDCLARGRAIFDGGLRYLGGTFETYGNTTAADSLTAIQNQIYRKKALDLRGLVTVLDSDFEGGDAERRLLRESPKFGNDDDEADAMAVRVHEQVCRTARAQAAKAGLHSFLVVIINNHANAILGRHTGASADGRGAGTPLSNANNPSPGCDRKGPTAFLNSLVKLNPSIHAGAVQNMKFSGELFTKNRPQLEALLSGYFDSGGAQAMITVVSKGDLEDAISHPEKYPNLLVRVGGFSARFVDLDPEVQLEILHRTLY